MSNHFEFLLRERKRGAIYLSTRYSGHKSPRRTSLWCQSDLYGPEFPPLNHDELPMQPGETVVDYSDDGTEFSRTYRVI